MLPARLTAYLLPFFVPLILRIVSKKHIYWSGWIVPILCMALLLDEFIHYSSGIGIPFLCVFEGAMAVGVSTILQFEWLSYFKKKIKALINICAKIIGFFTKRNHRNV